MLFQNRQKQYWITSPNVKNLSVNSVRSSKNYLNYHLIIVKADFYVYVLVVVGPTSIASNIQVLVLVNKFIYDNCNYTVCLCCKIRVESGKT